MFPGTREVLPQPRPGVQGPWPIVPPAVRGTCICKVGGSWPASPGLTLVHTWVTLARLAWLGGNLSSPGELGVWKVKWSFLNNLGSSIFNLEARVPPSTTYLLQALSWFLLDLWPPKPGLMKWVQCAGEGLRDISPAVTSLGFMEDKLEAFPGNQILNLI